ncbi:MAG: hypothetical protein HXY51_08875 [Nitrospirae bacterium]|nr:hypothetical protein [Nitrospirota bacterium]
MLKDLFMAFASRGNNFDRAAVRAGRRHGWVRVMTLGLVVAWSLLLQGCLAGAWVALLAVDTMRNSNVTGGSFEQSWVGQMAVNTTRSRNVTFGRFEHSWVAGQDQSGDAVNNSGVTSVAVFPVEGDPEMGARLATLLRQETALRVESPATVTAGVIAAGLHSGNTDDAERSTLAKEVTRDLGVDTILISRVTESPSHPGDWGWRAEGTRRLYLYLVNSEGQLLWKDELPFTLVNGPHPPLDTSVQTDLTHHVMQHVKVLRLDELGYLPNKEKRRKFSYPSATLQTIE